MADVVISIITATHNRSGLLIRLYESLKRQTVYSFEWIVVDDASTDNTWEILQSFEDNLFTIRKVKIPHGGKHRALNKGVSLARGELVFFVDDDDWLTTDAINTVLKVHDTYKSVDNICGYSFLRQYPNGEINTNEFNEDIVIASYVQARVNAKIRNVVGDRAEVFFTEVLKDNPFPEFDNEYFYFEDGLWVRLSAHYRMIHVNRAIYICDYLSDGLTKNGRLNKLKSPIGMIDRTSVFLNSPEKIRFFVICKMTVLWLTYNVYVGNSIIKLIKSQRRKILTIVCLPFSLLVAALWKGQNDDKE